jgi:hypothetical protein
MDCPIIIYDNDKKFIAETIVTGYGRDEMYLEVMDGLENTPVGTLLRLLVIGENSVSEFSGKLTSRRQGITEISIFNQKKRDSRGAPRFPFNINALINNFIVDGEVVRLTNPLRVTIKNMSSTGLMIESRDLPLIEGTLLNIEFKLRDRDTVILCKVVREPIMEANSDTFGCQLMFPK